MSDNTVYITAASAGLTSWTEFKKPPYSAEEYEQAYNNGINMTAAILNAHAAGASKVVIERGNYPWCFVNTTNKVVARIESVTTIDGTNNLEIDGNGSVLFVIYDSDNRSPYHTEPTLPPRELSGAVFTLENNTNLNIYGFELRGDNYNRSFINPTERNMEQTYGLQLGKNNINTKIAVTGHGFRGDVITGKSRGDDLFMLTSWDKGGVDKTTGELIEQYDAYRTPVLDLSNADIKRNAVQLMGFGNYRDIPFGEDIFTVFIYNSAGELIWQEKSEQSEFIYLPKDYHSMVLVAYGDERTEPTVRYGSGYLVLGTGASNICEVEIHAYANHRGAISNLCNNTTIINPNIYDNGTLKQGFPHYSSTTRYGINFEDTFVTNLNVIGGSIKNGGTAIIAYCKKMRVENVDITDMIFAGVGIAGTQEVFIDNCTFTNVDNILDTKSLRGGGTSGTRNQNIFISNIVMKNSTLDSWLVNAKKTFININGIKADKSLIRIQGNGLNTIANNITSMNVDAAFSNSFVISNALQAHNNTCFLENLDATPGNYNYVNVGGRQGSNNLIVNNSSKIHRLEKFTPTNSVRYITGLEIDAGVGYLIRGEAESEGRDDYTGIVDKVRVKSSKFNGNLSLNDLRAVEKFCDIDYEFDNCQFSDGLIRCTIRETLSTSRHKIVFKNSHFDLTTADYLIGLGYSITGELDIIFDNCTFYSSTQKSIKFFSGNETNVTMTDRGCRYINVKNTW